MLERFLHLKAHGTCLRNEILAGVTTFLAATGLAFGFLSYVLIKVLLGKWRQCDPLLAGAAILSLISIYN
jgi:xanthine/uracil/vitamin C permease (AzgA family)